MNKLPPLTLSDQAAILAGLHLLAEHLDRLPDEVAYILNDGGMVDPLAADQIGRLANAINGNLVPCKSAAKRTPIKKSSIPVKEIVKAEHAFVNSDEFKKLCEFETLTRGPYLKNRLLRAYRRGQEDAERLVQKMVVVKVKDDTALRAALAIPDNDGVIAPQPPINPS